MLTTLTLSFHERHVINIVLNGLEKSDIATSRAVRDVRKGLELKSVRKKITRLAEAAEKKGEAFDWEDILELESGDFAAREFTIDDSRAQFILERTTEHKWTEVRLQNGATQTVPIAAALHEAIADLVDSLQRGLTPKEK